VLTAAFSSLNAGLYSTGRILRSMAMNGSAPKFTAAMSSRGVPYGGIFLTAAVVLFGVILNLLVPGQAFEIVLNIAALGIIASWGTIVICQIQLYRWSKRGILERPSFRLWGTPYTGYLTLAFLFGVVVLMALDPPIGTWTRRQPGGHHSGAHRRLVRRPRAGAGGAGNGGASPASSRSSPTPAATTRMIRTNGPPQSFRARITDRLTPSLPRQPVCAVSAARKSHKPSPNKQQTQTNSADRR
jgi:amino acid transporter